MAKINNTLSFKNAHISLGDDELIELNKDSEIVHVLSDVIKSLEGKCYDIIFKETKDITFGSEE